MERSIRMLLLPALLLLSPLALHAEGDVDRHRWCEECGLSRLDFGENRMLLEYSDELTIGTCSLNCTVAFLERRAGKPPRAIHVADGENRAMIDATTATWVLWGKKKGGRISGTKRAFASPSAAGVFVKANGGRVVSWEEALESTRLESPTKR